uniref:TniQ domain-containing protein n=1 Tax=Hydrogenovibrio crunogenus (strain DSM 25203 / XCL-2) TaxID=317025 RepID=Q31F36_HYDCU
MMFTGKLWPVHPHPYPNELLSSWLVRIAHANGEKVQTFTHQEFGVNKQVWNRDIDRLAPEWLLERLSEKTATSIEVVRQTTLKHYKGTLFHHSTHSGVEAWITPLRMYHRKRKGFGLQFCPLCLKEDKEPYFRASWRVALQTFCLKHQIMMHDRCPQCGEAVTFHRIDISSKECGINKLLSICSNCRFDLSDSPIKKVSHFDGGIASNWNQCLLGIEFGVIEKFDIERLAVLHQFGKLLTFHSVSDKLIGFVELQINQKLFRPDCNLRYFEANDVSARHQIIGCAWWLLQDWPDNLYSAWLNGAVRYNQLLKDFASIPVWYSETIVQFNVNYKKRRYELSKK